MIARMIWFVALALVAALTASVQLDRQSALVPTYATSTPEPVRGFAQAQIAAATLQRGANARAVEEARLLVVRRPIPAENLRLLAQAQFAAGQQEEALVTIQIAAQRGWRDAAAQETTLRIALAAGDEAEAARRYTALFLKNGTEDALLSEFGAALFERPDGIAASTLVEILAGADQWRNSFVRRGARVLPPDAFVSIVIAADRQGARFDCAALAAIAPALYRQEAAVQSRLETFLAKRC